MLAHVEEIFAHQVANELVAPFSFKVGAAMASMLAMTLAAMSSPSSTDMYPLSRPTVPCARQSLSWRAM